MTITQIKKIVKKMTGFKYVSVRNGTGSLSGYINIFTSSNDNESLKPFETQLRDMFKVEIFSFYTATISV